MRDNRHVLVVHSAHSYADTVARLVAEIERRGLTVFARIDHAAAARNAGLELGDEEVAVFGNPKAGTGLMQANRRIGIELPLRVLAWADDEGVWLGYRDPREYAAQYDLANQAATLEAMATLLAELARVAAADG